MDGPAVVEQVCNGVLYYGVLRVITGTLGTLVLCLRRTQSRGPRQLWPGLAWTGCWRPTANMLYIGSATVPASRISAPARRYRPWHCQSLMALRMEMGAEGIDSSFLYQSTHSLELLYGGT